MIISKNLAERIFNELSYDGELTKATQDDFYVEYHQNLDRASKKSRARSEACTKIRELLKDSTDGMTAREIYDSYDFNTEFGFKSFRTILWTLENEMASEVSKIYKAGKPTFYQLIPAIETVNVAEEE